MVAIDSNVGVDSSKTDIETQVDTQQLSLFVICVGFGRSLDRLDLGKVRRAGFGAAFRVIRRGEPEIGIRFDEVDEDDLCAFQ